MMGLSEAQDFYNRQPGDPERRFVTPQRAKAAVAQTYADLELPAGADDDVLRWAGGGWQAAPLVLPDSSVWHAGHGAPDAALGTVGDFYLDLDTADVYRHQP